MISYCISACPQVPHDATCIASCRRAARRPCHGWLHSRRRLASFPTSKLSSPHIAVVHLLLVARLLLGCCAGAVLTAILFLFTLEALLALATHCLASAALASTNIASDAATIVTGARCRRRMPYWRPRAYRVRVCTARQLVPPSQRRPVRRRDKRGHNARAYALLPSRRVSEWPVE